MCAGTGKEVHIIIFTCARSARERNETMEERKLLLFKKIERKKKGKRGKKAERRKGIVEIDAEKKEKLKSKRMPYQAQLKKEFH